MSGKSKQESTTQQSSTTEPWKPTLGLLNDIVGGIQGQFGNYQPTAAETGAINTIAANAGNAPNYGPQARALANTMMGDTTGANAGMLGNAYADYQRTMNPYVSADYLDPTKAPGMAAVLDTIKNDVSNNINGMFAGAGRDLSGAHAQTLARGLSQGMAAPLLNQYNQNVAAQQGAARSLYDAGSATAGGLQNFTQQGLANQATGLDIAGNASNAENAGAMGILSAEALRRGLPLQNLSGILGMALPIAGLGGQSTGTATTTQTSAANPWQTAIGGALGGAGLFGSMFGGAGPFGKYGAFGK